MSSSPREANWPFVTTIGPSAASVAAAGSFALWLVACVYAKQPGSASETSTAGWTALALVGVLLSVALRALRPNLPASGSTNADRPTADWASTNVTEQGCEEEILWLLSWCVELNSLGMAAMLSPSLVSVLPTIAILLAAEVCLVDRMPDGLRARFEQVWQAVRSPTATSDNTIPRNASASQPVTAGLTVFHVDAPSAGGNVSQHVSVGVTDDQRAFQEGVMAVELAANQKSDSVAIAFSKAFASAPTVDLEIESAMEEVNQEAADLPFDGEVELDQITPSGMRLTIKRQDAQHSHRYQLHWYAIEDGAEHVTHERLLAAKLP